MRQGRGCLVVEGLLEGVGEPRIDRVDLRKGPVHVPNVDIVMRNLPIPSS